MDMLVNVGKPAWVRGGQSSATKSASRSLLQVEHRFLLAFTAALPFIWASSLYAVPGYGRQIPAMFVSVTDVLAVMLTTVAVVNRRSFLFQKPTRPTTVLSGPCISAK